MGTKLIQIGRDVGEATWMVVSDRYRLLGVVVAAAAVAIVRLWLT